MTETSIDRYLAIRSALGELWKLSAPFFADIHKHPAFLRLSEVCGEGRSDTNSFGYTFALTSALRSLGLPCSLQSGSENLAMPVDEAAQELEKALRTTQTKRIHLAPLDLAEELPELTFGSARVCKFSPDELRRLFDEPRLRRLFRLETFDAVRFSEFHWLVVEEVLVLDRKIGARALPFLSFDFSQDLGQIEPHKGRFPNTVEDALFFLLLAPWEEWSTLTEVDWRGFRVPWVCTIDHDLFVRRSLPPSPDSLSWEPHIYSDEYGEAIEVERPVVFHLEEKSLTELAALDNCRWSIVEKAKKSVLFETPIAHFLVRAFLADGMDEFLAHLTTIEAALGLQADYNSNHRITPDRQKKLRATKKVAGRLAGLLGDKQFADSYQRLFDQRSAYLHGRTMSVISSEEQKVARSLARKVADALAHTTHQVSSREEFLDDLLDKGLALP